MRLMIVRHGDPDYEHDSLTEKGRREAALLADRLEKEKIDYLYSSPMGRAKLTCDYTAERIGKTPVVLPWLREFGYPVDLPTGEKNHLVWDMLPSFWTKREEMYSLRSWLETPFFKEGGIPQRYAEAADGLNALLARHGYEREGNMYRAVRPNRETVALFCHFGAECILLSVLTGISPALLMHQFVALPTSVTTLYTEERRKGEAVFRCCAFGDTGHLYAGGETPSFSARFCETFDSDERHD